MPGYHGDPATLPASSEEDIVYDLQETCDNYITMTTIHISKKIKKLLSDQFTGNKGH